ncbi:MAG: hypothetical protein HXS54_15495 [Theionarchaea archaeon]|nr:hypothetical protein [Theionarchaea archaeon]
MERYKERIRLALKLNIPIWTNDKDMIKNEVEYRIISINEMKELLE